MKKILKRILNLNIRITKLKIEKFIEKLDLEHQKAHQGFLPLKSYQILLKIRNKKK